MKYALFALCLFISTHSTAQIPLDSIYRDGAEWTQFYDYEYWPRSSVSNKGTIGYTLTIAGDTTINMITYKKLYRAQKGGYYKLSYENFTRYMQPSGPTYLGCLRLSDKKLFYFSHSNGSPTYGIEALIYDFDLNTGDTFKSYGFTDVVTGIDSVQVQSGQYLKKFIFFNRYLIEGLGWHYGLLSTFETVGSYLGSGNDYGLCFNSGSIFYHYKPSCPGVDWYLLEKCFDMDALTIPNNARPGDLTIYPNPSQSYFTLTGSCLAKEAKVSIVNILGMVVHTVVIPVDNNYLNYTFNIVNQPDGIYRLLIYTGETQKIIPLIKG